MLYNLEYHLSGEDYSLDLLDKIHITVLNHDEVNGDYQVRPDGKITLPYAGSVTVTGLTVDQLVEKLKSTYSTRFRDPEIFINILAFGARIEELKKMISSDRRGQIFEATIRPDGYITLPIVGDIYASGRTPAELNEVVTAAYEPHYRGIEVSTIVRETASNVIYVMGEVANPGQLQFSRPLTLLAGARPRRGRDEHGRARDGRRGQHEPAEAGRPRLQRAGALHRRPRRGHAARTRRRGVRAGRRRSPEADLWSVVHRAAAALQGRELQLLGRQAPELNCGPDPETTT